MGDPDLSADPIRGDKGGRVKKSARACDGASAVAGAKKRRRRRNRGVKETKRGGKEGRKS